MANPELAGHGDDADALLFTGGYVHLGHVGDSRAYLYRDGRARQLSEDHSWIQEQVRAGLISPEEAKESRFRNIITRSVGFEPSVEPDLQGLAVQAGDCFVLCSDGLSNYLTRRGAGAGADRPLLPRRRRRSSSISPTSAAATTTSPAWRSTRATRTRDVVPGSLIVVHVHARVLPDAVDAFRAASIENARASMREPGIARFDVVQSTRGSDALRARRGLPHARRRRPPTRRPRTTSAGATRSPI